MGDAPKILAHSFPKNAIFAADFISMDQSKKLKLQLEVIWWFFTFLLAFLVMLPIMRSVPYYRFFTENVVFVITFVTFTRYIFLLKHSFIAHQKWVKMVIIGASVFVIFMLIMSIGDYNSFLKEQGLQDMVRHLPFQRQVQLLKYMRNEMLFFGVGAVIAAIVLPLRMVVSLWRVRNRGTV